MRILGKLKGSEDSTGKYLDKYYDKKYTIFVTKFD